MTVLGLAQTIADILGVGIDPILVPERPREVHKATCSADKARALLGYQTRTTLREGLSSMVDYIDGLGPREFDYALQLEITNDQTPCNLAGDPLYRARRTVHTGEDLLTDRQRERLTALFGTDEHVEVEATWGIYQRMIAAYRDPDRTQARAAMTTLIDCLRQGVPATLIELRRLGRTLTQRASPGLLRPARHQQRPDRSTQRAPRTPPRLRARLPQPDQLHRTITPGDRRLQTPPTPSFGMSQLHHPRDSPAKDAFRFGCSGCDY